MSPAAAALLVMMPDDDSCPPGVVAIGDGSGVPYLSIRLSVCPSLSVTLHYFCVHSDASRCLRDFEVCMQWSAHMVPCPVNGKEERILGDTIRERGCWPCSSARPLPFAARSVLVV